MFENMMLWKGGGGACGPHHNKTFTTALLIISLFPHWPKIDARIQKKERVDVADHVTAPTDVWLHPCSLLSPSWCRAAMSFSMLYFSMACVAQSTASCCMSSDMSAFLITAFLSVMAEEEEEEEEEDAWWRKEEGARSLGRTALKMNTARGDGDGWGQRTSAFFTQNTGPLWGTAFFHRWHHQNLTVRIYIPAPNWTMTWAVHRLAVKLDTGGVRLLGSNHFCTRRQQKVPEMNPDQKPWCTSCSSSTHTCVVCACACVWSNQTNKDKQNEASEETLDIRNMSGHAREDPSCHSPSLRATWRHLFAEDAVSLQPDEGSQGFRWCCGLIAF